MSSSKNRKRFALVGTGGRSFMYEEALLTRFKETSELVAICDSNRTRMAFHNRRFVNEFQAAEIPAYHSSDFEEMILREKPDVIIVTTMDRTHHDYIIRAFAAGCDVITEKPLTTDEKKCKAIMAAMQKSGRDLRVGFNYRYSPSRSVVKELLLAGTIGEVKSVHFEWLLDTRHGADYFRRWHRDKRNSGGLMVHKATHHFDLVSWWLDARPEVVFGLGKLNFYGRENGQRLNLFHPYVRSTDDPRAEGDPFGINLNEGNLKGLYLEAEKEDGYLRDQNVFGDGISIEDTMNLVVGYANGAQMSYSLTAYSPWEGYRIAFNGTKGRIELDDLEKSYVSAGNSHIGDGLSESSRLMVFPHWSKPYSPPVPEAVGGHGGGDLLLLEDLFGSGPKEDPLGRAAGIEDGIYSVLTGVAANRSFATGQSVRVADLLGG
jgi:predicted dehydrogenase